MLHKIRDLILLPVGLPALIGYLRLPPPIKLLLDSDLRRFWKRRTGRLLPEPHVSRKGYLPAFWHMFVSRNEFRAVVYMRLGRYGKLIAPLMPPPPACSLPMPAANVGPGLFIEHGWAMVLDAAKVGENLWINQNVTVGWGRGGQPTIGNNVRIGCGAIVLGGIHIGDNVNIGAGAVVVEDVEPGVTVCGPKAAVVRRHTEPTMNALLTAHSDHAE